jgi:hypothetical protein
MLITEYGATFEAASAKYDEQGRLGFRTRNSDDGTALVPFLNVTAGEDVSNDEHLFIEVSKFGHVAAAEWLLEQRGPHIISVSANFLSSSSAWECCLMRGLAPLEIRCVQCRMYQGKRGLHSLDDGQTWLHPETLGMGKAASNPFFLDVMSTFARGCHVIVPSPNHEC